MAGGAYRGLTIRIGADTKTLASGLRGANSAIHKTQTELRKLAQAAKIDPGNTNVASAQIGAMANQAMDAAAKMDTLNKSIAEMGAQKTLGDNNKTIAELAESTDNAALSAQNAKERYNNLTADLSKEFKSINSEVEKVWATLDKGDDAEMPVISFQNLDDMDSINKVLNVLQEKEHMSAEEAKQLADRIDTLKKSWKDADKALKDANMVESFKNAENEAARMEATINGVARQFAELSIKNDFAKQFGDVDRRIEMAGAAADAASGRLSKLNESMKLNPTSVATAAERYRALGDATDAAKAKLEAINQKIAMLKSDGIDRQNKSTAEIANNLESARTRYEEVSTSVAKYAGELENAKRHYQDLVDNPDTDKSSEEFKEAEQAVERYEDALKEAKKVQEDAFGDLKTASAVSELDKLEQEARETKDQIKTMGDTVKTSFGADAIQAASAFGDVMRDIGDKVIESSRDIDSAFRDLRKTFDASEQDYDMLYDAAMKYAQTHVTSADSMLEMESIAAQVGIGMDGGAEAIQHFAEVAGNLDVATDIDAETIALQMGQIVNVMDDLREDNVERFGDALVRLGNTMPAQESSIMQITQRLAAVGSVANFTTPELMGWAAAIAGTGQRSEAAATGISNTITAIQKAVGKGGDALDTFAEVAGMSAEQFAESWRTSPTDALQAFLSGLDGLGDESLQKLEDLDITGVRQTQTLLALAQTTDTVRDAIGKANDAWGDEAAGIAASGDAAAEAEKKAEGFSGSLSKMENSVQVLAATFGSGLAPYIDMVAGGAQLLTNVFTALGPDVTGAVAAFGALTGGLAAVYPIVSKVTESLKTMGTSVAGGLTQGITKLALKFGDAETPIMGFGSALMSLGSSGAIFWGGFGAVALAVIGQFIKDAIDAKQHADNLGGALKGMSDNASGIDAALGGGAKAVKDYGEAARDAKVDVDALIESVNEHNQRNEETRSSAEEQIAMLGEYKSVIDEMAGAGDASAEDMAKLQWALDGLADATGETYSKEQVLTGQFKDESGEIRNTAQAIDDLIAKKQEEARVNALTEMYSDTLKTQLEAEKAVNDAQKERNDYIKESIERYKELGNYQSDDQVVADLEAHSSKMKELNQNIKETQEIYDGTAKEAEYYAQAMGEATMAQYEYAQVSENAAQRSQQGWSYAAQQMGTDADALRQSLLDAGLSAEQIDAVTGEHFAHMAAESGGSIEQIIEQIANYNEQEFEDKHSVFLFDEEGNLVTANNKRVEWNAEAGQWQYVETGVKVSDEDLELTKQTWQQFYDELNGKEAQAKVTADTTGVDQATQAVDEMPSDKEVVIKTTADTSGAEQTEAAVNAVEDTTTKTIETKADTTAVDETNEKIDSLPDTTESNVTVTADTAGIEQTNSLLDTLQKDVQVNITANTGNLQAATGAVGNYNKVAGQLKSHRVSASVSGNAVSTTPTNNVKNLNSAMGSMSSRFVDASVTGNAINRATANEIWNLVNAVNNMRSKEIVLTTRNVTTNEKHAKGGVFPGLSVQKIPMNAEGFIAKSATMTNYGWVGENGAEAYFGDTLIPLTNRKYSTPWVNDTSDAVVRKLAKAGAIGGNTANVSIYVDGSGDPEAVAHAIADRLRIVLNAG